MRAFAGECGRDSAHYSMSVMEAVARMDCPVSLSHDEISEDALFTDATLHRFGLPYDYAKLEDVSSRKIVPPALFLCGIMDNTPQDQTAYLYGNVPWADAEAMAVAFRPTRS